MVALRRRKDPNARGYQHILSHALAFAAGWIISRLVVPATTKNNTLRRPNSNNKVVSSSSAVVEDNKAVCNLDGSFDTPADEIIIDYEKIRRMDKSLLTNVKDFTSEAYVNYLLAEPGKEHYPFLSYLSSTYGDCRHFTDIGTRVVASALALGSNLKSPVWTFDLPSIYERKGAFRGRTEEEWQSSAQTTGLDIKFHNLDLMKASNDELKQYLGTWFVMLDTFHQPDTVPFEREFFQRMIDIGFKGILALDDIHLNSEMKQWWKEVQDGAERGGYHTYDISEIGHISGTGLVDFSGKVTFKK